MLALCWHNMPTHYAFLNYADIFDGDLTVRSIKAKTAHVPNCICKQTYDHVNS